MEIIEKQVEKVKEVPTMAMVMVEEMSMARKVQW